MTTPRKKQLRLATLHEYLSLVKAYNQLSAARREPFTGAPITRPKPVSVASLLGSEVAPTVLSNLYYLAHVEHLHPAGIGPDGQDQFVVVASVRLGPDSYFSLTDLGVRACAAFFEAALLPDTDTVIDPISDAMLFDEVPRPCYSDRQFRWGNHVIKHFKQPASDQETVLLAAEELNFPEWFDDPLPRQPGKNPKKRLHDTIQNLNRNQHFSLIHFKSDGSGTRIGWEIR